MAVRLLHSPFFPILLARVESTVNLRISVSSGAGEGIVQEMSPPQPSSYTTIKERAICEREIKRSKFIAIAAPISDERSAQSFLSEGLSRKIAFSTLKPPCERWELRNSKLEQRTRRSSLKVPFFLDKVQDLRATHNCWAYKLGDQYRSNDDGEPSGTAGRPIYSAIVSSGVDMVIVVVIRYFGGIKLGTGGLARAYGGVALDCLKGATTCFVKPTARFGIEVPFDLLGPVYHQLQSFHVEDIKQDYDTGKDGFTMLTFRVDYEKIENLENTISSTCSRKIEFYKTL